MKRLIYFSVLSVLLVTVIASADNPYNPGHNGGGSSYSFTITGTPTDTYNLDNFVTNTQVPTYTDPGASTPFVCRTGATSTGVCPTQPVLVGGNAGTPSAIVLTNATGLPEQITAIFDGGGSAILTSIAAAYVHRDFAFTSINKWTVTCDLGASDSTPIIVNIGGKVTTASTSGALPTIASNGWCGSGTPPTGNSSTAIAQAAWNCSTTSISANTDIIFSVTQAPTASTKCYVTLEVTR